MISACATGLSAVFSLASIQLSPEFEVLLNTDTITPAVFIYGCMR